MTSRSRSPVPVPWLAVEPSEITSSKRNSTSPSKPGKLANESGTVATSCGGSTSGGPPGGGSMRAQARSSGEKGKPSGALTPRRTALTAPAPQQLPLPNQHLALLPPGGELLPLALHHVRRGAGDELLVAQLLLLGRDQLRAVDRPRRSAARTHGRRRSRRPAARTPRCRRRAPHGRRPAPAAPRRRGRTPWRGGPPWPARDPARHRARRRRRLTTTRTAWPGCTPYSARMARMAPTSSCTRPNSRERRRRPPRGVVARPRRHRDRGVRRAGRGTGARAPR